MKITVGNGIANQWRPSIVLTALRQIISGLFFFLQFSLGFFFIFYSFFVLFFCHCNCWPVTVVVTVVVTAASVFVTM